MDCVPTTNMVLARRALQANMGKDVVDWAIHQLVLGQDTPYLRRLAGFTGREDAWEMEETIDRTLRELGLSAPDSERAASLYARELAGQFFEGAVGCEFLLRELCGLCIATGYPHNLYPFADLRWALDDLKEQGWSFYIPDATLENFDEILRARVKAFLKADEKQSILY